MVDLNQTILTTQLNSYSDASANENLGFGAIFNNQWIFGQWEPNYISMLKPSIEYLELYALCAAVLTWGWPLRNTRIVFCDNLGVVNMINKSSYTCRNYMYLIRLLTLSGLLDNRRVFARHVAGINNSLADSLSRLQFDSFWKLPPGTMARMPSAINRLIWPPSKMWQV